MKKLLRIFTRKKSKKRFLFTLTLWTLFLSSTSLMAQTISGNVLGQDGSPLIGASVLEASTQNGTITDIDGNFSINMSDVTNPLTISYIGYQTITINAVNGEPVSITLYEGVGLDDVVVSALGISREKKSLGYAVTELSGSEFSLVKESNVASSLAGKVAGVVVNKNTSGVGGATRVIIRGNNSLSGNNEPLYVVDGVPIDNTNLAGSSEAEFRVPDLGNGISDINPDDIESMSILKGPNAAALYGSRASNGVVLITTKKGALGKGLGVSLSSSTTFENPFVLPQYQNEYGRGSDGNFPQINASDDLATQVNAVASASSWGPRFDGSNQLAYNGQERAYSAQPDNVKDFFETGVSLINTVALSNSTENSSVRFSYTKSDLSSILPNSEVDRNNFNLRGFTKLGDKLSLDSKITYFQQKAKNRAVQGTEGVAAYVFGLARNVRTEDLMTYQKC